MTRLCTPSVQEYRVQELGSAALVCPAGPDSGGRGSRLGPAFRVGYPRVAGPFNTRDRTLTPSNGFNADKTAAARVMRQVDHAACQGLIRAAHAAFKCAGLAPMGRRAGYERRPSAPGSGSAGGAVLHGRALECRVGRAATHGERRTPVLTPCPLTEGTGGWKMAV